LLQNRRADHSIGETVRLAFIGRLDDQKNPIRALMVTHSLSQSIEVELTFYGDGPLKNCVEQTAESLGLNISMMGYHPFAEICADFDILLNTSNYEGSPYLFLEAAAINLPVITTKVGGAIELKDRGIPTHLLQENYDFTEIANFIRANTGKGHSCKYTAVQYSSDEMVREYADLFVK
ncbi:glycosyltransferase family 4 protein, partial [bacterium]|nr:glycosyltransferase family 4 protein [bacterium]